MTREERKRELAAQEAWEDAALCVAVAILALCALAACVGAVLQ